MKHISTVLEARKQQLDEHRQLSLFATAPRKGSAEWSAFNTIQGDQSGSYRVRLPRKPIVIAEPHNILRIIYPIRRLRGA